MTTIEDKISESLKAFGSTEAQIADALVILPPLCETRGDEVVLTRAFLEREKPHLLPPATSDLADAAFFFGNLTARGALAKTMSPAALDALAQRYGLRDRNDFRRGTRPEDADDYRGKSSAKDGATNPWSNHPNWLDSQGRYNARAMGEQSKITKAMGLEKASALARAAGSFVGATKPRAA
jgi:hypothetical protein